MGHLFNAVSWSRVKRGKYSCSREKYLTPPFFNETYALAHSSYFFSLVLFYENCYKLNIRNDLKKFDLPLITCNATVIGALLDGLHE